MRDVIKISKMTIFLFGLVVVAAAFLSKFGRSSLREIIIITVHQQLNTCFEGEL